MATIKDKIFPLFGAYDSRIDVNKDSNGKGTLERYNEALAEEYDEDFETLVTTIYENVKNPKSGYAKYLSSLELGKGNDYILPHTLPIRRDIQLYLKKYWQIKGTAAFLNAILGLGGFAVTVTENYADYGFDSPVTFDAVDRKFDLGCGACSQYSVVISRLDGSTEEPSQSEWIFIESVIGINEPIDTKLKDLTFDAGITLDQYIAALNPEIWINPNDYLGSFADNSNNISFVDRVSNLLININVAERPIFSHTLGANGKACFRFGVGGLTYYNQNIPIFLTDFTCFVVRNVVADQARPVSYISGGNGKGLFALAPALSKTYGSFGGTVLGDDLLRTENVSNLSVDTSHKLYTYTSNQLFKNTVEANYADTDNMTAGMDFTYFGSREPSLPLLRGEFDSSYFLVFGAVLTSEQITYIQNGLIAEFGGLT